MTSRQRLHEIAEDTIARSQSIIASTPGASSESTFIKDQLAALDRASCPNLPSSAIQVQNFDAFTTARNVLAKSPELRGKIAVLNLASDEYRAGGWRFTLCKTQEEALCYSSTLYETLKEEYYEWPNLGPGSVAGVFSPAVVIFKDDLDHGCAELPVDKREVVSVITVAAPRIPDLTADRLKLAHKSDLEDFRGKIRLVYRMAAHNGQHAIILGAMGCGAYGCPPRQVAEEMKSILLEDEFKGWFKEIVFAVYSNNGIGEKNNNIFTEVFAGSWT